MKILLMIVFTVICTEVYASCKDCHATTIKINEVAVQKAKAYSHIREAKNDNRHPDIDKFHRYYGLPYGNPWRMMFVGYSYYEAFSEYGMKTPIPRTARVSTFTQHAIKNPMTYEVVSTKKLLWGADTLIMGDMISFKHGKITTNDTFNWNGHIGIGLRREGQKFICIEGNTKPKFIKGADETGRVIGKTELGIDGVYIRERVLGLETNFPMVYIIRLKKREY